MRKRNPSEPTGNATERVTTYWRTPKNKRGRQWLEENLGQLRLFEYNPAKASIIKLQSGFGVMVNSQLIKKFGTRTEAVNYVKSLRRRAEKLQSNPGEIELYVYTLRTEGGDLCLMTHYQMPVHYVEILFQGEWDDAMAFAENELLHFGYKYTNSPQHSKQNPPKKTYKVNPGKWFAGLTTAEEVKQRYKELAKQWHPDKTTGDLRTMQEINAEFDAAMKFVLSNEPNEFRRENEESASGSLREAIEFAVTLPDDVIVTIRGNWLWLEGNTFYAKDQIKSFQSSDGNVFKFANKKKAWFFAAVPSKNRRGEMSFDEIEELYGKSVVSDRKSRFKLNPNDIAAKVAGEFLDVFDVDDDGELDRADIQALDDFELAYSEMDEPVIVVDETNEIAGEILTETVDGDVVIAWADGVTTIENKDDLAVENGLKSWIIRQRAGRQYKKALRAEEKARAARSKQSDLESKLRQNPGILSALSELAVGGAAALEINRQLKRKKRTTAKKRNPSFSQVVANARKQGLKKIPILKADLETVRQYGKQNGGQIRKTGNRFYFHLPKLKQNPVTTRGKKNPGQTPKRNSAFSDFQGRESTKTLSLITPPGTPQNLWSLGKLFEFKVLGIGEPYSFRKEDSGKHFYLLADNRNKNLYIGGGKIATKGEREVLGEIVHVVYETYKPHLGDENGIPSPYIHKFGEEGGKRPVLVLDADGFAHIEGGDYEITPFGIRD